MPLTLAIPDGKAVITLAKALALYKAHFLTTATDLGGDTIANVSEHPIRVINTNAS